MSTRRTCRGCDTLISKRVVACPECWARVPSELRAGIRLAGEDIRERMLAVGAVLHWLKDNRS